MKIVVDVDDVILELNKSVEMMIQHMGYPNFRMENILTYDLNSGVSVEDLSEMQRNLMDNGLGCPRNLILQCYSNLFAFQNAKISENAILALKMLSEKNEVLIQTVSYSLPIASFKVSMFERLNLPLKYEFCIGTDKKVHEDADWVIDDSLEVLSGYSKCNKIVIDKPYNRERFNARLIKGQSNLIRVSSLYESCCYILRG